MGWIPAFGDQRPTFAGMTRVELGFHSFGRITLRPYIAMALLRDDGDGDFFGSGAGKAVDCFNFNGGLA